MPDVKAMAAAIDKQAQENQKQNEAKVYYGHADVFEESTVRLSTSFKGKRPEGKAEWVITDGSKGSEERKDCDLGGQPVVVTLAKVPDDKAKYDYIYKLEHQGKTKPGVCDFTVWPTEMAVTAKYKTKSGDPAHPTLKDGDPVPGFQFRVVQGEASRDWKTDDTGACAVELTALTEAFIEAISPWEIITPTDQTGAPRKRELEVSQKPWKAKILNIADGRDEKTPLKWYVNKDANASRVKVEVGPEDKTLGKRGQKVKVRATFPKENSKRDDPKCALWRHRTKGSAVAAKDTTAKPGEAELVYETEVEIKTDGQPATFYLQLGVAGGDKCKLEVGVTDAYEDDKLHLENWRKIVLEMLVAKKELRQTCTDLLKDDAAELGDGLLGSLKKIFEGTFIELEHSTNGCKNFEKTDLKKYLRGKGPGLGFVPWANIVKADDMFVPAAKFCEPKIQDGDYVYTDGNKNEVRGKDLGGGTSVFLCSDYQRRNLRASVLPTVAKPDNSMTWVWMDYITSRSDVNTKGTGDPKEWDSKQETVWNYILTAFEAVDTKKYIPPFHVFDYDPLEAAGTLSFKNASWMVSAYRKKGDPDWIELSVVPAECPCPACVSLRGKGKEVKHAVPRPAPGVAYKDWQPFTVFADKVAVDKWVTIKNSMNLELKLPKSGDPLNPGPGDLVQLKVKEQHLKTGGETKDDTEEKDVDYELKIHVYLEVFGIEFGVLGGAVGGQGDLRTSGGTAPHQGMANVMAHEIAHNCGQTFMQSIGGKVGGVSTAISGIPFGKGVPDGHYYVAHGHQGSHCIKPVFDLITTDEDKTKYLVKDPSAAEEANYARPTDDARTKFWSKVKDEDHCVMYGEADADATKLRKFCEECVSYLKAVDLADVTKSW